MKVVEERNVLEEMSRDAGIATIVPRAAFLADTEEDLLAAVAEAERRGVALTARGGGTSIPDQALGDGMILLQRRQRVSEPPGGGVSCEPGVVKQELNRVLDRSGLWMPVDPSSYKACTVGGMVANNSSGSRTLAYGSTVDYVEELRGFVPAVGLRAVRPVREEELGNEPPAMRRAAELLLDNRKEIEDERPRVTKNSCGYRLERVLHDGMVDFPKLMVGSEGTLCLFSQVRFRALVKPASRMLLLIESPLEEIDRCVSVVREQGPSAVELVDKSVFRKTGREDLLEPYSRSEAPFLVFCEFEAEKGGGLLLERLAGSEISGFDPLVLTSLAEVSQAWDVRNQTLAVAGELRDGARVPLPGVEDLVVPQPRLGDLIKAVTGGFEERGLQYISYGHAGDANLHMRPLLDPGSRRDLGILREVMEECFELVWRMGGSISGEHGDGRLRAEFVKSQYPRTHSLMKEVREVLDPKGLLNPGVKIV